MAAAQKATATFQKGEQTMAPRFIYSLIGLAIVIIGFGLWKMTPKDAPEVQKIYRTTPRSATPSTPKAASMTRIAETSGLDVVDKDGDGEITILDVTDPHLPFSHPDNVAARLNLITKQAKELFTPEELANEDTKRFYELVESEAFKERVQNGATLNDLTNFLAGNGMSSLKDLMHQPFRELFPNGDPADYEPEMREKLKSLIIKNGGYDPDVFATFLEDKRAFAWHQAHFGADFMLSQPDINSGFDWFKEVKAEALHAINTTVPNPVLEDYTLDPQMETPRVDTSADTNAPQELLEQESRDAVKDSESVETPGTVPVELPQVRSVLELPTNESLEKNLQDSFSPARFNKAIEILNRYGPKEGLRRLKESDPKIATRLERLIQSHQENNE
jgi:hypothetical protein